MDKNENYLVWVQVVDELSEAKEHLDKVIKEITGEAQMLEDDLKVDLGHVYAHLNRTWHLRNSKEGVEKENWGEISKFRDDLEPVG